MAEVDAETQAAVDNVVSGEGATDNEGGAATDDNGSTTDQSSDADSQSDEAGAAEDSGAVATTDDSEEDDDDDDSVDYQTPFGEGATGEVEPFDITKVPRDAQGLLDPAAVNKAINDHIEARLAAKDSETSARSQAEKLLTTQWERAGAKYPHVVKNPKLAAVAQKLHLNSIGTKEYLSPLAATKQVHAIYRDATSKAKANARVQTTIEKTATTGTSTGNAGNASGQDDYSKAREMVKSSDPNVAREGRLQIMRIRRHARSKR